jgi:hypothetical protein
MAISAANRKKALDAARQAVQDAIKVLVEA